MSGTQAPVASPPVPAAPPRAALSRTPTLRAGIRRRRIWIVLALVLLGGALLLLAIRGLGGVGGQPLGPADPSPAGAKAVVEVLRNQGVEVTEARSLERAADLGDGATVLVYDEHGVLDGAAYETLRDEAALLVVVAPDFAALSELAPGVRHAGAASGPLDQAGCDVPAAERAGELSDGQRLFTIDDDARADGWRGCFADQGDGSGGDASAFAIVTLDAGSGPEVALVGSTVVFANESVAEAGNAALALGLTGAGPDLVWYLPGPADAGADAPTLGELTPGWVSPLIVLAVLVTVAAGIWRGRRLGRLVVEDLPVTVPAGETSEGRARLYAAANARTHALDQLRIGTVRRLAALLRLPVSAGAEAIITATANVLGADPGAIRGLLLESRPDDDRALVELAVRLDELERRVQAALNPGSAPGATAPIQPDGAGPDSIRPQTERRL